MVGGNVFCNGSEVSFSYFVRAAPPLSNGFQLRLLGHPKALPPPNDDVGSSFFLFLKLLTIEQYSHLFVEPRFDWLKRKRVYQSGCC